MPQVIPSAKALIYKGSKFLILKQTRPESFYWDLPGGKIEYKESPKDALIREVKEETGLKVDVIKILGVWWFYSPLHKHQIICITYLCKSDKFDVDILNNPANEQIEQYKWVSKEEFLKGGYHNQNKSLIDFISLSGDIVTR